MEVEVRFARRARVEDSVSALNASLIQGLSRLGSIWRAGAAAPAFDPGVGESASTDLSLALQNGIRGAISFASRFPRAVVDRAISDDIVILYIDSDSVSVTEFCETTFLSICQIFGAYRASVITDVDADLDDYEKIVELSRSSTKDLDGRDAVYRLKPVNFFDEELCSRAFGLSAGEVANALRGFVHAASVVDGGVYIALYRDPLEPSAREADQAEISRVIPLSSNG